MKRPTWDEYFTNIVLATRERSPCERLQVGCLLVKDNRIISQGYNGFLPGCEHKSIVRDHHEQATIHAEQNAITHAAKVGLCIENSIVYITHYPCINCAKIIAASGIKKIKYYKDYNNNELVKEILLPAGIAIQKYES